MPELWDVYDKNRMPTGKVVPRGEPLAHGEYYTIIEVWTVNSSGEILLTLRHSDKRECPNKWEDTGGCVQSGEDSRTAAVRELFEEAGIKAEREELFLLDSIREEKAFVDIFMLERDVPLSEIRLCEGETTDAKWVSVEMLDCMIDDGSLATYAGRRLSLVRRAFDEKVATIKQ